MAWEREWPVKSLQPGAAAGRQPHANVRRFPPEKRKRFEVTHGTRGPIAKPVELKLLEGNQGKRRLDKRPPGPGRRIPRRPSWLSPEAREEWRRLAPELTRLGLLTLLDRAALTIYCDACATCGECPLHPSQLPKRFPPMLRLRAVRPHPVLAEGADAPGVEADRHREP